MKLEPARGISIDLEERFVAEMKDLPERISLSGNAMLEGVARKLLSLHASRITVCDDGERIALCSIEEYGARALRTMLSGTPLETERTLLSTIPEELIIAYARKAQIPVVEETKDSARIMLDTIARSQPQTYYSLARSIDRLLPVLRDAFPDVSQ